MTTNQADALASAPEVGVTAAQTRVGSRQHHTEAEKAQAQLDKAKRSAARLNDRVLSLQAELTTAQGQRDSANALVQFWTQHPALSTTTPEES